MDRQKLATDSLAGTQAPADARRQEAELKQAVSRIQDFVQNIHRELRFSVDRESGRTVISVIDSETDKVIRQIPPEEAIAVSKQLRELSDGILLRVQA